MKTKSVSLSIEKKHQGLSIWYKMEIELNEASEIDAFLHAKSIIEQTYQQQYGNSTVSEKTSSNKELLDINSPEFDDVKSAILNGRTIQQIEEYYNLTTYARNVLENL